MNPRVLCLTALVAFPIWARAGFADISVEDLRNSAGLHEKDGFRNDTHYNDPSGTLGTQTRNVDFAHQSSIEIAFTDMGETPQAGEYSVDWFFFSKDLKTKKRRVFDHGSAAVTQSQQTVDAVSKKVAEHHVSKVTTTLGPMQDSDGNSEVQQYASQKVTGEKIEGWVVRLKQGSQVIKVVGSLPELESMVEAQEAQYDQIAGGK